MKLPNFQSSCSFIYFRLESALMISIRNKTSTGAIISLISTVVFLANPKAHIILISLLCLVELNKILRRLSTVKHIVFMILAFIYIYCASLCYLAIYNRFGAILLMLMFLVTTGSDSFSYIFGSSIKKLQTTNKSLKFLLRILSFRPIKLSPNKTLIGYLFAGIGGMIGILIYKITTSWILPIILAQFNQLHYMSLFNLPEYFTTFKVGFILGMCGQVGDLLESAIKRLCGVKDSGSILAEHGGICDRYDSMYSVIYGTYFILFYTNGLQ